jgi:uncharacterized protein with ACT and thioredoxin-like domain
MILHHLHYVSFTIALIQLAIRAHAFAPNFTQLGSGVMVLKKAVRKLDHTFALNQSDEDSSSSETNLSRREIIILAVGGTAYAQVASSAISKIKRGDAYPEEHEMRVAGVFRRSIMQATSSVNGTSRPLRILEVGIGDKCRTIMRGMYDDALKDLSENKSERISGVEMFGVDIDAPYNDVVTSAREKLGSISPSLPVTFNAIQSDLEKRLDFPDKYFGKSPPHFLPSIG